MLLRRWRRMLWAIGWAILGRPGRYKEIEPVAKEDDGD